MAGSVQQAGASQSGGFLVRVSGSGWRGGHARGLGEMTGRRLVEIFYIGEMLANLGWLFCGDVVSLAERGWFEL